MNIEKDNIEHPQYYIGVGTIEPLDFIMDKQINFPLGNVIKYCVRAGKKDGAPEIEDLKKARVYLDRYIKHLEELKTLPQ